MAIVTLLEAQPLVAAGTATTTVRLAGGGRRAYAGYRGNTDWRAGIVATPRFTTALGFDQSGWTGGAIPQATAITFGSSDVSLINTLAQLFWTKAPVTIWTGDDEAGPPAAWTTRMVGTVADVSVEGGILTLTISDLSGNLTKPVATGTFAGTGGVEGGDDATGRIKRRSWGRVFNVEGRVLDKANNIYEFGDPARPLQSFDMLKDRGRAGATTILAWQGSVAATFAALQVAVCPASGGVVAPSIACAKWWTQPSAPLTADLRGEIGLAYVETGPEIAQAIASSVSAVAVANLAAVKALRPAVAGIHVETNSETAGNLLDRLLLNESLLWAVQPTGEIAIREWTWAAPVETLTSDTVTRDTVFSPLNKRKLGFQHNERIQSDSEISAILLASTDVTYVDGTPIEALKPATAGATAGAPSGTLVAGLDADTLVSQASTAFSNAASALSQLLTIASDNILSKGEKSQVIADWSVISSEKGPLDVQSYALGVGSAAYDNAYTALSNYLVGLSPAWNNLSLDTPIVGNDFRAAFTNYYTARVNLVNAIAQKASTKSYWSGITDDNGALAALLTQAATAASNASSALSQLTTIASDNVLSKGEKSAVIGDWAAIVAEADPLQNQASALGVDVYAFATARANLGGYLTAIGAGGQSWNDPTVDTPINGDQFRAFFSGYYTAKINLINAMAQAATNAGPAPNELPLSDFSQGLRGFTGAANFNGVRSGAPFVAGGVVGSHNIQVLLNYPGYGGDGSTNFNGVRRTVSGYASGRVYNTEYIDFLATKAPWGTVGNPGGYSVADSAAYMLKVKHGDRVYARCSLAQHRCNMQFYALIFDKDGGLVGAPQWGGARDYGGANGDPANMNVVGGVFNISDNVAANNTPAFMCLLWRMIGRYGNAGVTDDSGSNGGQEGYFFMTEPAMGHLTKGQTALPPYVDGPGDPVADKTSENTALDTMKLAGRDAAALRDLVDQTSSIANTANSIAAAAQSFTNDIADNNKASPDEKKRYVALLQQWSIDVPAEINQLAALGCPIQASALNAAWTDFYNYLVNTVAIYDTGSRTYFDRGTFLAKSNLFQQRETEGAIALENRAKIIAQDTGANMFLDPLFKAPSDTTCWASFSPTNIPQDALDGRRVYFPPDIPGESQCVSPLFIFGAGDRIDYEFEYFREATSNVRFGMFFSVTNGSGGGLSGTGTILDDAGSTVGSWQKVVGSFKWSDFSNGNVAQVQPYLFSDQHNGPGSIYIRNPKAYRVVNALGNVGVDGRQKSPLLTTAFAIASSVSVTGLNITSNDTVIGLSSFYINFGGGFQYIGAKAYGGLAPSTTYHIWLIAPSMNDGGAYLALSTSFTGNTDPNGVYIGYAKTQASGGGTTTPPATGGGGDDPGLCVANDMFLFEGVPAGAARAGDPIDLLAIDHSSIERSTIEGVRRGTEECVRLVSASGIEVDCSVSTPMERQDGSRFWAPNSEGELLFVDDDGDCRWEPCIAVQAIGPRPVSRISVRCRVYMAGRAGNRRIATHNLRYDPKA